MRSIIGLVLLVLISCQTKQEQKSLIKKSDSINIAEPKNGKDSFFIIDKGTNKNSIKIIPPSNSSFQLPDSTTKIALYKNGDFNANGKEDILVYLGACGKGGCMYALFLNQYDKFYQLAFMDYLKNIEFKMETNGLWIIKSSEELTAYNPSKIQVTIFKFNKNSYQYKMDTTFVYHDK